MSRDSRGNYRNSKKYEDVKEYEGCANYSNVRGEKQRIKNSKKI